MRKVILASASESRKEILAKTGLKFTVEPSDYEEDMTVDLEPMELAKFLAEGKAKDVAQRHKDAVVIGADTFVVFKGELLGKPHTPDRAREMLKLLSGTTHIIITGFVIIDSENGRMESEAVETKVRFKKLSDEEIEAYVHTKEPLKMAGAYGIGGRGCVLVEEIEGDFYNVVGLPLCALAEKLKAFGVKVLS
jgi:septum formation protein